MERKRLMEIAAWNVVGMYDPYELADVGGDEYGLFCETVWLLEENPKAVMDWLTEA